MKLATYFTLPTLPRLSVWIECDPEQRECPHCDDGIMVLGRSRIWQCTNILIRKCGRRITDTELDSRGIVYEPFIFV